ncbi:MAG: oxygen-independent coproporphyrinogen III oxidase [Methylacidiphilales bacterium]|nr:oxygen-independent coproporphyrinogen III oxidase [Candidatus Methylacidiphilales bacterium]
MFLVPDLNFDLLARYNVSGPRYTSYPTAPQFTEKFTGPDLLEEIRRTHLEKNPPPLSLYYHLPFCKSVCFYCGCNVTFTRDRSRGNAYIEALRQEMDLVMPYLKPRRPVVQLHWGGGTPTFCTPEQLSRLFGSIRERFEFAPDAEIGVEVDPRETSPEHLQVLGSVGFNRLSVGIQDFDPKVQEAVNRLQSEEATRATIDEARKNGFQSVSVDLMYGLPLQTASTFATTLDRVLALDPDRLALFNFAYLPAQIRHQKAIREADLPSPREKLAIFKLAVERLLGAGYAYIGMDHFAKPGDDLRLAQAAGKLHRNFQGYTTHAEADLYAFGVSSISSLGRVYAQNRKKVGEYMAEVEAGRLPVMRGLRLTDEDLLRRHVIMRLMCDFELDMERVEREFGIDFHEHFSPALETLKPMEEAGLLEILPSKITVRPTGRFLIRNIAMCFDAYLQGSAVQYSRTV